MCKHQKDLAAPDFYKSRQQHKTEHKVKNFCFSQLFCPVFSKPHFRFSSAVSEQVKEMDASDEVVEVVPESVMDAVKKTLYNVEKVKTHLEEFLSLVDPQLLAEMTPLERAKAHFAVAKAATVLYSGKILDLFCGFVKGYFVIVV